MDHVEPSSTGADENIVCPICGNLVSTNIFQKWGLETHEAEHVGKLLRDGSLIGIVRIGELASKQLNPDRLSTDFQLQNSLEALSRSAEELLRKQGKHLEEIAELARQDKKELLGEQSEQLKKITESERQDKKDVREEAVREQQRILEDYQKKFVDLQGKIKETTERYFTETQKLTAAVAEIQRKIVGPGIGRVAETSLVIQLKSACPQDNFSNVKATRGGADIVAEVMEQGEAVGKIVVSSKAVETWSNEFREQLQRNLAQERTRWGILVTKCFPADALSDRAYLDSKGLFLVKTDYAPVAYLGMRQAVINWSESQTRLLETEERVKHEQSILRAMRGWVAGEKFSQFTAKIAEAKRLSNETDDTLDSLETLSRRQTEKAHEMQQKLRVVLGDCDSLLDDLKDRLG